MKPQCSLKNHRRRPPLSGWSKTFGAPPVAIFSAEDKIRIVLDGLRGEDSIAGLCRKQGIAQSLYYVWSKEIMKAGKRRLTGDTARAATSGEVQAQGFCG